RSRIHSKVTGGTQGNTKAREVAVGGANAHAQGARLRLQVGFAHPLMVPGPTGPRVALDRHPIPISGANTPAVGQFAAQVRAVRKPEPYNSKGIKSSDEVVKRKQGKALGS